MGAKPAIVIHAGAGSGRYAEGDVRFRELARALEEGRGAMRKGSSTDGVVAAVEYMEECGAFNAGRGACTTAAGTVELDAAVMWGEGRRGAGVGSVTCTYHPVKLARWVALNTPHILVVGDGCAPMAKAAGLETGTVSPSESSMKRFEAIKRQPGGRRSNLELLRRLQEGNTVGAAAVDQDGEPAAAVSTGGMWMKLPGRVGDSAILGAGVWAESGAGAASATGTGEEIIKNSLCAYSCGLMRSHDAETAARRSIAMMTRKSGRGTAGIVTVDAKGRTGTAFNSEAMGRAWFDGRTGKVVTRA